MIAEERAAIFFNKHEWRERAEELMDEKKRLLDEVERLQTENNELRDECKRIAANVLEGARAWCAAEIERNNDVWREIAEAALTTRDEIVAGYTALKKLYEGRWTSVDERLPEPDNGESAYLVIETDGQERCYEVLMYLVGDGWFEPGTGWHNEGDAWEVTHWQLLPPLP